MTVTGTITSLSTTVDDRLRQPWYYAPLTRALVDLPPHEIRRCLYEMLADGPVEMHSTYVAAKMALARILPGLEQPLQSRAFLIAMRFKDLQIIEPSCRNIARRAMARELPLSVDAVILASAGPGTHIALAPRPSLVSLVDRIRIEILDEGSLREAQAA